MEGQQTIMNMKWKCGSCEAEGEGWDTMAEHFEKCEGMDR